MTLSITIAGLSGRSRLVPYIMFQLLGGLAAGLTLKFVFGSLENVGTLGSTELALGIDPMTGILIEVIGTFILTTSILVVSTLFHDTKKVGFLVGMTLFVLVILFGPLTGGSFNPARSIGPSLASGYFDNHYVYWIGPLIGGILSGFTFRVIRIGRSRYNSIRVH